MVLCAILCLLLPAAAQAWTFGVCGDSRSDRHGIFPRILAAVEDSDMEFLIHLGDLENSGGRDSWETFRARTVGFSKPLHPVVGNHELQGSSREEFARFFGLAGTSRSFTHRDAHVVLLDNGDGTLPPDRLRWLDEDLAAHPKGRGNIRFLVVAMHYPPRTDELFPHGTGRRYEEESAALLSILRRREVDLLLAGHEHLQHEEEWGGIRLIVTGGAGAPMVPFQPFGFYRISLEGRTVRPRFLRIRPGEDSPPAKERLPRSSFRRAPRNPPAPAKAPIRTRGAAR